MVEIFFFKHEKPIFLLWTIREPNPLKIKISKIGLRHILSWPKLGFFALDRLCPKLFTKVLFLPGTCAKKYSKIFFSLCQHFIVLCGEMAEFSHKNENMTKKGEKLP